MQHPAIVREHDFSTRFVHDLLLKDRMLQPKVFYAHLRSHHQLREFNGRVRSDDAYMYDVPTACAQGGAPRPIAGQRARGTQPELHNWPK